MATKYSFISTDEWLEKYKPLKDSFGEVRIFETYGAEVEFVKSQDPLKVWTLLDDGEGEVIISGWHFINRVSYYIAELPFGENEEVWVFDEVSEDLKNYKEEEQKNG